MKEEDIGIRVKCDEHFAVWYMGTVLKNPKSEVSRRMKERLEKDWVAGWYMDGGKEYMFENAKVHGFVAGMREYPFASPRTGEKEIKELAERLQPDEAKREETVSWIREKVRRIRAEKDGKRVEKAAKAEHATGERKDAGKVDKAERAAGGTKEAPKKNKGPVRWDNKGLNGATIDNRVKPVIETTINENIQPTGKERTIRTSAQKSGINAVVVHNREKSRGAGGGSLAKRREAERSGT